MDFVNKVSKKVNDIANKTADGVNKLAETAKLEHKISVVSEKLDDLYSSIGRMKYSELNGENVSPEMYADVKDPIDCAERELKELKARLSEIKNSTACPMCGSNVKKGSNFCPNCGNKID